MLYSLESTINLPHDEIIYELADRMDLDGLNSAIAKTIVENPDATSFVFVTVQFKS